MNTMRFVKTESADGKQIYYMCIPGVGNIRISKSQSVLLQLKKGNKS